MEGPPRPSLVLAAYLGIASPLPLSHVSRRASRCPMQISEGGTIPAPAFLQIKAGGDGNGLRVFDPVRPPPCISGPACGGPSGVLPSGYYSAVRLPSPLLLFAVPNAPPSLTRPPTHPPFSTKGYVNTALCRSAISYIDGDKVEGRKGGQWRLSHD